MLYNTICSISNNTIKDFLISKYIYLFLLAAKYIVLILLLLGLTAFYILVERNIIGAIQRRKGPNVVGVHGLLQSVADGIKLIAKEITIPSSGNPFVFILAPIITMFIGLASWAVIPFCNGGVISNINIGILYLFAVSSIGVYAIILSGWSSNSKYAFLGAVRSATQMLSYEVIFGLSLIPIFICTGSLNLSEVVYFQLKGCWFIYPFLPLGMLFFVAILAETNRHPFDLPEAEAELVSGYNVEYSSMVFALFFLGEYLSILNMCALTTILFLGGWGSIPFLSFLPLPPVFWFSIKIFILGALFVIIRCVLPRFRYDQLVFLGWRYFIPFCLGYVLFVVSILQLIN